MAAKIYKTASGLRVPSVTTVLSRFKQAEGLMHWAWQQGVDGNDYRDSREEAAGAGTLAHQMIEAHLLGLSPEAVDGPDEQIALAKEAFRGFLRWLESTKFIVKHTELSLVSNEHSFGGTLDCIGSVSGALVLGDWKSSNRIYSDYLAQLGGYAVLWEETHPGEILNEAHLLRFGKADASFHHHAWLRSTLEVGMRQFLLLREAYANDTILRKAVG